MNYGINNNPLPPELEYAFKLQAEAKNRAAQARQSAMNPQPAVPQDNVVQQLESSLFSRMAPGVMQQGQRSAQQPMRQGQAPMRQAQQPMRQGQAPMRQAQAPNAAAPTPQQMGKQLAQGLSGVPAPNMQRMADGGIVGYAQGGMQKVGVKSKGPIPQMSPEENAQVLKYLEGLKKFDYLDKNPDKVSPEGRQALELERRMFEEQFPNEFRQKVNQMMYGPSKGMAMGGEVKKFQAGKTVTLDLAPRPYTANGRFYNANGQEISEQDFSNEIYMADQYDEQVRSQAGAALPVPAEQSSDRMSNEGQLYEALESGYNRFFGPEFKEQMQEVAADPRKNSIGGQFGGALEVGGEALTKAGADVYGGIGEYFGQTLADIGIGFGTTGAVGEAVETTSEAAKQQAMELLNADYAAKREALRAQLQVNGGDVGPEARARIEAELAALQEAYNVETAKLTAQTGLTSLKKRVGDFYKTNIGGETSPEGEEVKAVGIEELIEVEPTDRQKLGSMVNRDEAGLRDNKDDEPEKGRSFIDKLAGIAGVLGRGAGASKGYEASKILETTRDLRNAEADRANRLEEQGMLIGARKDIAAEELAALTSATQQEQLIVLRDQILSDMAEGSGQLGSIVEAERERLEKLAKPNMIFGSIDPAEKAAIEKQMATFKNTLLNAELQKALTQISQMQNQFKGLSGSGGIQEAAGIGSYLDLEDQAST